MDTREALPVIVGFDGSERSEFAVTFAAQVAASQKVQLIVLHAADHLGYVQEVGTTIWNPEEVTAAAQEVAERGAELARTAAPGLDVDTRVALSSGALALEEASSGARLVVVGNSGHGRVAGIILGSTAFHVATRASSPVLVVPVRGCDLPGPNARVAVATDGSDSGRTAVLHAADVAARYDAPLQIITAWEPTTYDSYGLAVPVGFSSAGNINAEIEAAAQRTAQTAAEDARGAHPGLEVTTTVGQGRPIDVIAEASEGAADLVVGARGRGDLRSLLLGSTSRAVLHVASCPVEIVR